MVLAGASGGLLCSQFGRGSSFGATLLFGLDQVAQLGFGSGVLLGVLLRQFLTLLLAGGQAGGDLRLFDLLLLELGGGIGQIGDERLHLIGGAGALVECHLRQFAALQVVGEHLRGGEHRCQPGGAARGELVDGDGSHLRFHHRQRGLLGVDRGLRDGDFTGERVHAVERGTVLFVEVADAVLQGLQLIGDLGDLALLIADRIGVGRMHADEHRNECDGDTASDDRCSPHDDRNVTNMTNVLRGRSYVPCCSPGKHLVGPGMISSHSPIPTQWFRAVST